MVKKLTTQMSIFLANIWVVVDIILKFQMLATEIYLWEKSLMSGVLF